MSSGKGGNVASAASSTGPPLDVMAGCTLFRSQRDPKDAASFNRLASLPVRSSMESGLVCLEITQSCVAHPRNRVTAGPTVVRRVCQLLDGGLVKDRIKLEWCKAVRCLLGGDGEDSVCDANVAAFVSAGGIKLLLTVLDESLEDVEVAFVATEAISILAFSPASKVKLLSAGCVKYLYEVMAVHRRSERVQNVACLSLIDIGSSLPLLAPDWASRAILGVAMNGDVKDAIVLSGGLGHLYATIEAHPASTKIQAAAWNTIAHITATESSEINKLRLITSGGLQRLYATMSAHLHAEAVLTAALTTISNLAATNLVPVQASIMSSGALRHIYHAMDANLSSAGVQDQACGALLNLCNDGDCGNKAAIMSSGGLKRVCAALAAHTRSGMVQYSGCGVLANLASDKANVDAVMSSGALDRLYAAMTAHQMAEDVQEVACKAIGNLASGDSSACTSIVSSGGMDRIQSTMRRMPGSPSAITAACEAFVNIVGFPQHHDTFVSSSGGLDMVYQAMSHHPTLAELQLPAIQILVNLSASAANVPVLKAGRAAALTRAAMRNHPSNPDLQPLASKLLARLV